MKRFIALTAASLIALTGAASAMTTPGGAHLNEIRVYAPGADVSHLSASTLDALSQAISGGDTESEKRMAVRAILAQAN